MKATLKIKDLALDMHIGAYEEERAVLQTVLLDIDVETNITDALVSDDLCDALDYMERVKRLTEYFSETPHYLIETAANKIADIFLEHPRATWVQVLLKKPTVLKNASYAGICIEKRKV